MEGNTQRRRITGVASDTTTNIAAPSSRRPSILRKQASGKWLRVREYLLIFIEASLALTEYVIRNRILEVPDIAQKAVHDIQDLNGRQVRISLLFFEGFSALVSVFLGFIAGPYSSLYTLAFLSVALHFGVTTMIMMERVVINSMATEDPYGGLMIQVSTVALILIKSTDFTRLVYALEGMHDRRLSTVSLFIFFQFLVSRFAATGGIFINLLYWIITYYDVDTVIVSFVISGFSLFAFWWFLYPLEEAEEATKACDVIGCLLLAIYYQIFKTRIHGKKSEFLVKTRGKYSYKTISSTRLFVKYVAAVSISCLGIAFVIVHPVGLFWDHEKIKSGNITGVIGIGQLARNVRLAGMIVSYFVLRPLMITLMHFDTKKLMPTFIVGYFLASAAMYYGGVLLMHDNDSFQYNQNLAYVRIFNTREEPVQILHSDKSTKSNNVQVPPRMGETLAYQSSRQRLYPVKFLFNGTKTNISMFMSVIPGEVQGFMILDPPQVVRIRGKLPVREGLPGTNKGSWSKIFIYNTATTLYGAMIMIKKSDERNVLEKVKIQPGTLTTIALRPATYEFIIPRADLMKTVSLHEGGLYGLMIHSAKNTRRIDVDTLVGANKGTIWVLLGQYLVLGLSYGLAYPSLKGALFTVIPRGLLAPLFSVISFLEGISLWVVFIGFKTWHKYMTPKALFAYASGVTANFILFFFFYVKDYRHWKHRYHST